MKGKWESNLRLPPYFSPHTNEDRNFPIKAVEASNCGFSTEKPKHWTGGRKKSSSYIPQFLQFPHREEVFFSPTISATRCPSVYAWEQNLV